MDEKLACRKCERPLAPQDAQRCSRCKVAIYCGAECQKAHWKAHKFDCKAPEVREDIVVEHPAINGTHEAMMESERLADRKKFLDLIQVDAGDSVAWCRLGLTLENGDTIAVEGKQLSDKDCFLEALRLDSNNGLAWCRLGQTMSHRSQTTLTVNGKEYTKRQCYLESLRCYPNHAMPWESLGMS